MFCAFADAVQWREIAFCLSQLQMSERSVRGLVDNFRLYKHTLGDEMVCSTFKALASKIRKSGIGKGDLKEAALEWERQILAAAGASASDDEGAADDAVIETLSAGMKAVEVA